MSDPDPDPDVSKAIANAADAQQQVYAVSADKQCLAFQNSRSTFARAETVVTTVFRSDSQVTWTDAAGQVQTCNGVRIQTRTDSFGVVTRIVTGEMFILSADGMSYYAVPPTSMGNPVLNDSVADLFLNTPDTPAPPEVEE